MTQRLIRAENKAQLACVRPFFEGWRSCTIDCALEGAMGSIWTCAEAAEAAVCETGDFLFLSGNEASPQCETLLKAFEARKQGCILVSRNEALHARVGEILKNSAVEDTRFAFQTDMDAFDREGLAHMTGQLPDGVELRLFDSHCVRLALQNEWSRDFCFQFVSEEDYLARGFGVAAMAGEELVGGASTYAVCAAGAEIQIDVRSDWRRQGIASACAAAFVLECFRRGIVPEWDAISPASACLARKLGFREAGAYPVWLLGQEVHG